MLLWFKTDRYIADDGTRMISEALKINSTLTELNLRGDGKREKEQKR